MCVCACDGKVPSRKPNKFGHISTHTHISASVCVCALLPLLLLLLLCVCLRICKHIQTYFGSESAGMKCTTKGGRNRKNPMVCWSSCWQGTSCTAERCSCPLDPGQYHVEKMSRDIVTNSNEMLCVYMYLYKMIVFNDIRLEEQSHKSSFLLFQQYVPSFRQTCQILSHLPALERIGCIKLCSDHQMKHVTVLLLRSPLAEALGQHRTSTAITLSISSGDLFIQYIRSNCRPIVQGDHIDRTC